MDARADRTAAAAPRVAVLPFDVRAGVDAWAPADSTALDRAVLAALREGGHVLAVAAPVDTAIPHDRNAAVKTATALGVAYLLIGAVTEYGQAGRAEPRSLQVAFQLLDAGTGALHWADEANATETAPAAPAAVKRLVADCARTIAAKIAATF